MSTVDDVVKFFVRVQLAACFFSVPEDFISELQRRFQEIGDAVCVQTGTERGSLEAIDIPAGTELGEEAERLFQEFKDWVSSCRVEGSEFWGTEGTIE